MIIQPLPEGAFLETLRTALREDIGLGDITTECIIPSDLNGEGVFVSKANGILSGLEIAANVFSLVDSEVVVDAEMKDGMPILRGMKIAHVRGHLASMVTAERVALNFMQRMSGIATQTSSFVKIVEELPVKIMDTRKTVPGLRAFDRIAVRDGRGSNHRFGLDDMVLIKDNHITIAGSVKDALELVQARIGGKRTVQIELEVDTLSQVGEFLLCDGVDIVLLDNFSIEDLQTAVKMIRKIKPHVQIEASGNVNESIVRDIAETGVDRISIGALTHSVRALDISFDIHSANW